MAVCVGDLDSRQLERLRVALAEGIAANFAYPPFFGFRASRATMRPIDRGKQEQISDFVRSVNFSPLDHVDVGSPEVRRFAERLFLRYMEVDPDLTRPRFARRLPEYRARAPRIAGDIQRGLLAYLGGQTGEFGARQPQRSWAADAHPPRMQDEELDHHSRILEAALIRARTDEPLSLDSLSMPAVKRPGGSAAGASRSGARPWAPAAPDETTPVPAQGFAGAFGTSNAYPPPSARSGLHGYVDEVSDQPTGQMPAMRNGMNGGFDVSNVPTGGPAALAPDLVQMYGAYLEDMAPEAYSPPPAASAVRQPPPPAAPAWNSAPSRPQSVPQPVVTEGESRRDNIIFSQLRYQLESFIRTAARSYGLASQASDPAGVIDTLRRSGFVDESDLTIAEGILALSDRVANNGMATLEDYRQAMTLYLLYHRTHLTL